MPRPSASVPPDAIRIEDEVWQEAFARREPARPRPDRRLHVVEGGRAAPPRVAPRPAAPPTVVAPRPAAPPAPRTIAARASHPAPVAVPERRTVVIRGYGAERNLPWPDGTRPRPHRRAYERTGFQPDRVAMWAVLLGVLLVVVAIASAHG